MAAVCVRFRDSTRSTTSADWSPDGTYLYVVSSQSREGAAKVFRVNAVTGKMDFWKTFGENLPAGVAGVGGPRFSSDGSSYAYVYSQRCRKRTR